MHPSAKVALISLASTVLMGAAQPTATDEQIFSVPLSGQAEMNIVHRGTGDLDGIGSVKLIINPADRLVCYDFTVDGVATPMMAYIHQGPQRGIGPPIIGLFYGVGSDMNGCVPANTGRLSDIISNPSLYYVSIATTEFPDGALRGQLA